MSIITEKLWTELVETYRQSPEEGYARMLHVFAMQGVDNISDDLKPLFKKDKEKASRMMIGVYSEFLALYLHLTNRNADDQFGRENASKIQSFLVPYVVEFAKAYYVGDTNQVKRTIFGIANEAEGTYASAKYWLDPDETNSLKVFADPEASYVRFLKRLSKPLEKDFDNVFDRMYLMKVDNVIFFFNMVNLDEWLKGVAMHLNIAKFDSINLDPPINKRNA